MNIIAVVIIIAKVEISYMILYWIIVI